LAKTESLSEKLSPYLYEALGMESDARILWLSSVRRSDPDLASQLETLLREHQELLEEHFLENRPASFLAAQAATTGQTIGPYTLVSLIGEGGMGTVWLAERNDGRFRRRAAVKFLRGPFLRHAEEERFNREGGFLPVYLIHTSHS
jgi:serine/threonine protein kinase